VGAVGGLVNRLLLGTVTNSLGQTVQRLIDQSTGSIIEKAVTSAGQQAAEKAVGNITQLPVISTATDAAGNIVKRAKDAATNAIVQYTLSKAGKLLTTSIIQAATR
jgi:proline dehydrogenase